MVESVAPVMSYQQTLRLDAGPGVENDALYKTCVDNDKLEEPRSKAPPK